METLNKFAGLEKTCCKTLNRKDSWFGTRYFRHLISVLMKNEPAAD